MVCLMHGSLCALFAVDCKFLLRADTGRGGLLTTVSRLPLKSGRGRCCALFPCPQGDDSSSQAGQVRVSGGASLSRSEAAFHSRALVGTALLAEQPTE